MRALFLTPVFLLVSKLALSASCPFEAIYGERSAGEGASWASYLMNALTPVFAQFTSEPNPSVPVIRSDLDISQEGPERYFYQLSTKSEAPVFKTRIGPKWIYVVQGGELAKQLMFEHGEHLGRGNLFMPFKHMVGDVFFAKDGPEVQTGRPRFYKSVGRRQINFRRINQVWEHWSKKHLNAEQLDFYAAMFQFVLGGIGKCFVGIDDLETIPADAHLTFIRAAKQVIAAGIDPISHITTPKIKRDFRDSAHEMQEFGRNMIAQNIESILQGDNYVFDLLQDRANQLGRNSEKDLRELLLGDSWIQEHGPMTLFASMNVGRSLYYVLDILKQHPEIAANIQDEIRRVIGEGSFELEHLDQLTYTDAVIREALFQLTPIPAFPREVLSNFELEVGMTRVSFSKGDMLMLLFRKFQGEGSAFNPERWTKNNSADLWAFGKGHRKCPAERFAIQLIQQFLVNMFLSGVQISPVGAVEYTTRHGGLGPHYSVVQ